VHRGRKRAVVGALTAVAMIAGMLGLTPAAQAQPDDVTLFMPDNGFVEGEKDVLADHEDGTDERAHLTAVATEDAEEVIFVVCDADAPVDTETAACDLIGEDESPNQPADEDLAFETFWNIPDDDDETVRDIHAFACDSDVEDEDLPDDPDCVSDVTEDVYLDDSDADDDDQDYSTGEMTEICSFEDSDACDEADFDDYDHGDELPTDGFTLRFRTDDTVDDAWACLDLDTDATSEPTGCDSDVEDADDIDENDDDIEWEVEVDAGDYADNDDIDVVIGCDDADCETLGAENLVLDEHYGVPDESADDDDEDDDDPDPTVDDVVLTFREQSGDDCDDPSDSETNEFDGDTAVEADLDGCIFDNDGDLQRDEEVTFEIEGVGGFVACEGLTHDHDDDGDEEHCHVDGDSDGDDDTGDVYDVTISNETDDDPQAGAATVTFCIDNESRGTDAGTEDDPSDDHGCNDEPAGDSDTATKLYQSDPAHVHGVFDGTEPDLCHDGSQTASNVVGDTDTLIVCTMDDDENAASTTVDTSTSIQVTSSNPSVASVTGPTETGNNGRATFTVTANAPGTTTITIRLRCTPAGGGDCPSDGILDEDSVTKTVAGAGECNNGIDDDGDGRVDGADPDCAVSDSEQHVPVTIRVNTDISIFRDGRFFHGRVTAGGGRVACEQGRRVRLKKNRPGRDKTIRVTTTNASGAWSVFKRHRRGSYYAVAARKVITQNNGDRVVCLRARSRNI
jgi:hypothetical protein